MAMAQTQPLTELTGTVWDAVVVGSGPAGAMAARGLSAAGARVLLVDRVAFPRPKICGCCLSSRALAVLSRSGMAPAVMALAPHPYDRLHVAAGGSDTTLCLPAGVAVSRERLDAALVGSAISTGARFVPGVRATLGRPEGAGRLKTLFLDAGGQTTNVTARVVIAAAGLGSGFALRELGGERVSARSRIGAHAVIEGRTVPGWSDRAINMAIGADGYVGAVRLEDGRWNLAAAVDIDSVKQGRGIASVVRAIFESVDWPLCAATASTEWRGTPRLSRRPMRVAAERLFAVGDSAGYIEPFTGEGMACALEGGHAVVELALQAAEHWEPEIVERWTDLLTKQIQRRMALPAIAAWTVRRPRLAVGITALLSRWPDLAGPAIHLANAAISERSGGQ